MPSNFLPTALSYTEHNLLSPLVGAKCAHRLLTLDLTAIDCFKLLISKCLGIAIILGGTVLKVPQILKIVAAGSADGISFVSYLLETVAYVISLGYNVRSGNPFSTYGEMGFITLQNLLILTLILTYTSRTAHLLLFLPTFLTFTYALFTPTLVSQPLLTTLQYTTILIGVASKIPQIINNFSNKSTGQLSAVTVFLQFAGSAARVFTTLQEVNDSVLVVSAVVACALNAVVLGQVVWYWKEKGLPSSKYYPNPKSPGQKKRTRKAM